MIYKLLTHKDKQDFINDLYYWGITQQYNIISYKQFETHYGNELLKEILHFKKAKDITFKR